MTSCAQNKCTPSCLKAQLAFSSFAAKPRWNALKDVVYQAKLYQEIRMIHLSLSEWMVNQSMEIMMHTRKEVTNLKTMCNIHLKDFAVH
jgi:hypothetical protein